MQTKKQSLLESITNTMVGFLISLAATFVIFPIVGFESTPAKNIIVTLFFTVVSILRGYVIRRFFNKKQVIAAPKNEPDHLQDGSYQECGKKNCAKPVYEFGCCFHHYVVGEMETGG